jgi:hypothetical protein
MIISFAGALQFAISLCSRNSTYDVVTPTKPSHRGAKTFDGIAPNPERFREGMFQDFSLCIECLLGRWWNRNVSVLRKNRAEFCKTFQARNRLCFDASNSSSKSWIAFGVIDMRALFIGTLLPSRLIELFSSRCAVLISRGAALIRYARPYRGHRLDWDRSSVMTIRHSGYHGARHRQRSPGSSSGSHGFG